MKLLTQLTLCLVIGFSLQAKAALVARDLDGNFANGHEAVYDTVLDITWLANANLALSNTFGVSGINSDGLMFWNTANNWISAMNTSNNGSGYMDVDTWRMPKVDPLNGEGFTSGSSFYSGGSDVSYQLSAPIDALYNPYGQSPGATSSELAYHYYNNFEAIGAYYGEGNTLIGHISSDISGLNNALDPNENKALFTNIPTSYIFWTGTESTSNSLTAFAFSIDGGLQGYGLKDSGYFVWAVADGDIGVAAVPIPAGIWLFGSALMSLISYRYLRC